MFHRGERGCAYRSRKTGEWEPVIVLVGMAERGERWLHFGKDGPEWRGRCSSVPVAVLRRVRDGQRLLLHEDFSLVEVAG